MQPLVLGSFIYSYNCISKLSCYPFFYIPSCWSAKYIRQARKITQEVCISSARLNLLHLSDRFLWKDVYPRESFLFSHGSFHNIYVVVPKHILLTVKRTNFPSVAENNAFLTWIKGGRIWLSQSSFASVVNHVSPSATAPVGISWQWPSFAESFMSKHVLKDESLWIWVGFHVCCWQ